MSVDSSDNRSAFVASESPPSSNLRRLIGLGSLALAVYVAIAWVSPHFAVETPVAERPILTVLALFSIAFGLYLVSLRIAVRCGNAPKVTAIIVLFAAAFRAVLLPTTPIQEIDIYRYLWDGEAVAADVNPFRYSPQQVLDASTEDPLPGDLRRLVLARDSSPAVRQILSQVHYGELPTVYPPVSQLVFACAAFTTPRTADVHQRLVIMKSWIVLFDLLTLGTVIAILRHVGRPPGWCLTYAWCPLVLKEFANSGHLDSIAAFLSALAVLYGLRAFFTARREVQTGCSRTVWLIAAAMALGLSVGAKLYAIVLAPLFFWTAVRRFGWRHAAFATGICLVVESVLLSPMIDFSRIGRRSDLNRFDAVKTGIAGYKNGGGDPGRGLRVFLTRWEMNDFLFLIAVENLKPPHVTSDQRTWFVITPTVCREMLADVVVHLSGTPRESAPFLLARVITAIVFLGVALWWAARKAQSTDAANWIEAIFLTLAWFWLLAPTQNPWYWIWSLPFLPFARSRAWLAMSGLVFSYYLRFWFAAHWPDGSVWPTRYDGVKFFDFIVTWLEFAPWLGWLAVEYFRRSGTKSVAKREPPAKGARAAA